jgi:hypothetical protein
MGRLHRGQEQFSHGVINAIPAQILARLPRQVFSHLGTDVNGPDPIVHVSHGHPSPTAAAENETLQESMALAHGPTPLFRTDRAILIELLNVAYKLFPAHIPRMMIPQHDRPIATWHPAIPRFAARRFTQ